MRASRQQPTASRSVRHACAIRRGDSGATSRRNDSFGSVCRLSRFTNHPAGSLGGLSEIYTPDNLLDRVSDPATLAEQYERGKRRERELLDRHLGLDGGDALSVGCGWHPVGAGLALANRAGLGPWVHGTPDDIPLSPRRLAAAVRAAGLTPELHAVTYGWRRLPEPAQRALHALDPLGSRPRAASLGHTLMLIARR